MAAAELNFSTALQTIPEKKKSLSKTVSELEKQRNSLVKRHYEWKELDAHFTDAEKALKKRYEEYLVKERAYEAKRKDVEGGIEKRDVAISAAEQASLARVQEKKDAAVAEILEQKRKWNEERQRIERELGITAKAAPKDVDSEHTPAKKPPNSSQKDDARTEENPLETKDPNAPKDALKLRSELAAFCENFDGLGIRKFIADNRKDSQTIRLELPAALKSSVDPERIVLKAVEGSFDLDRKATLVADKKDPIIAATRRACIILLEALADVLADPILGVNHPVVSPNIKEAAKVIADDWKSKINFDSDASTGFPLDAQSFLQLVATFGLASAYDQNELSKLVLAISRRKQTPSLCRALGLISKIPDIIDMLIKNRKIIEALSFAHQFSLFDRYEPVSLLKSYLKETQKTSDEFVKKKNGTPAAQKTAANKELSALRTVLKCIDEYKLEDSYCSGDLQTRVAQLEKTRDERKRTAGSSFFASKKPRTNAPLGALSKSTRGEGALYRPSGRASFGGGGVSSFGIGSQHSYDRPLQGGYGAPFSGGTRSPASLSRSHLYSADALGSTLYGSSAYANPSSSYNSYQYGTGLALHSAYQGPYTH